jgi:hypothetical protein
MPFNGGGFSGGFGFGQVGVPNAAPLNQYLGAATTAQSVGVAQYGAIWASSNCSSCDVAIREMQGQINRVSGQLGAGVQIAADGKVGSGTVQALQQVAAVAVSRGNAMASVLPGYVNPEMVAKNADKIRDILKQISGTLPATAPVPILTIPSSYPTPVIPTTFPATSAATKSKLPYIIGGAILFVGVIAAGVILMTPKS